MDGVGVQPHGAMQRWRSWFEPARIARSNVDQSMGTAAKRGLKRYINPQCSAEDVSAHTRPTALFTLHPHASAEAPPKPTMAPVAPGTEALRREGAGLVVDLAKHRAAGSAPSGCLRWFGHVHACGARESG